MRSKGSLRAPGAVLLVSCYELGHQPLGLAWPKAFLERAGYAPETCDLSLEPLAESKVRHAAVAAIAVPMHTALRLGVRAAELIHRINPACRIVFHGLYAFLNAEHLREHGADAVLSGEAEAELLDVIARVEHGMIEQLPRIAQPTLARLDFLLPSRAGLLPLARYAHFIHGERRVPAGYVEASRGCLHECLHCPIPPVYGGRFFVIPREVVLADIRQLVAAGAGHITFGDPDFLNGPGHALRLVRALHAEFPEVTYDCTAKVEHVLAHRALLPELAATGCAFLVSAIESLSDVVLANLAKGHTRADVFAALHALRAAGIPLRPSLLPFTPWSTLADYVELLDFVEREDLVDCVDPVQYTIRLLVPPGSLLVSQPAIRPFLGSLDAPGLTYRWRHPDARMDLLHETVSALVEQAAAAGQDAATTFERVRRLVVPAGSYRRPAPERPIPARLSEPWFC